jgi:hypothetical protein
VVFVKLDACALRILLATHAFLIEERYRGRTSKRATTGLALTVAMESLL